VFQLDDPAWSRAPWLSSVLDSLPSDGTQPHYMTAPHPDAVGSLGSEFDAWVPSFLQTRLRWWQRLAAYRLLEVDEAGDLIWWSALLSASRQVGKSVLLRLLALFLLQQEHRWGPGRDVMLISRDVAVAAEIQRPAILWVKHGISPEGWEVKLLNGRQEVIEPGGNRWMVRSRDAVYGYSAATALCDEAWTLPTAVIEEGIEPILVERRSGLLLLASTPHRRATSLMRSRRAAALANVSAPDRTLLLEWSAPADAELDDMAAWRAASPHWSARREELIRSKCVSAMSGTGGDPDEPDPKQFFRTQWLGIWPAAPISARPGKPLVDEDVFAALRVPGLHLTGVETVTGALEAVAGHPPAIGLAWRRPDGRIGVIGRTAPTLDAAWRELGLLPPGSSYLCGLSWRNQPEAVNLNAEGVGTRTTEVALPLLADLVSTGSLAWDGQDLAEQMAGLRVADAPSAAGKTSVRSADQTHVVRAAAWAVWKVSQCEPEPQIW
jgi:hypothetical protein